jgi:hypothetical protein
MSHFVYQATELADCARQIVSESKRPLVAVAFWGAGIIEHLGLSSRKVAGGDGRVFDEVRIILNLASGGTNASVVEQLRTAEKEFKKRESIWS